MSFQVTSAMYTPICFEFIRILHNFTHHPEFMPFFIAQKEIPLLLTFTSDPSLFTVLGHHSSYIENVSILNIPNKQNYKMSLYIGFLSLNTIFS